jgi:hypothetical protein
MPLLLYFFAACVAGLLLSAIVFHILARLGSVGNAICDACAAAPLLDIVVFYFTHGPWVAAIVLWCQIREPLSGLRPGSAGLVLALLGVAIAAQIVTLLLWCWLHEAMNPGVWTGPRIVSTLNRKVGRFRNHAAVWWTALAVPLFTVVRLAEILLYPPLTWLVHLPKHKAGEWINVSRQKFSGLVGHDLIWCLYCDWMTGVWSLASEMLRNVESFWCPIRYTSPEKCEKCCVDFPDINGGWVDAKGNIAQVASLIDQKYPGPGGENSWFGHPARAKVPLTVNGKDAPR